MIIINKELDYKMDTIAKQFKEIKKEINKQKRNENK